METPPTRDNFQALEQIEISMPAKEGVSEPNFDMTETCYNEKKF